MNMVIDIGNSLTKVGTFEGHSLKKKSVFATDIDLERFLRSNAMENLIMSSVKDRAEEVLSWATIAGKKIVLGPHLPIPILNRYATPGTLGVDRLAAACGAWALFPNQDCLVVDIGTCINYELISKTCEYLGGAISPGVVMRFESMHHLTAKLPNATPIESVRLTGSDTIQCLQSGVMNGVLEEIKGTIHRYQIEYPGIRVILCGGDAHFFENHLKPSIFVAPELVLMGLNSILLHNVNP